MNNLLNYIAGTWKEPSNGLWLDNPEPATGEIFSRIPDSGEQDIQMAVESAKKAFIFRERFRILNFLQRKSYTLLRNPMAEKAW